MGLLDSMDDPRTLGLLSLGLRMMSTPGRFGTALGTAGMGALGDVQALQQRMREQKRQEERDSMVRAQFEAQQAQLKRDLARRQAVEDAIRGAYRSPEQTAVGAFGGPTVAAAGAVPTTQPTLDQGALVRGLMQADPERALPMLMPKPRKLTSVAPGASVIDENDPTKPVFTAPDRPEKIDPNKPFMVVDGKVVPNPAYQDYAERVARAGATNIGMPKIEVKTGESVAAQVGPMMKDSKIKVGGAIKMFDAADRIEKALDSGLVTSGPMAGKIQTVKQFAQVISGGNDESIRQTQQVIRSLAQMAVEARKQLQGQGQVTENEAKAVMKADAGDINDLTVGELRDLVALTKRASHYAALEHADNLSVARGKDATRELVPFFDVRGMEPLLKHSPNLPQIGGGDIRSQADAILRGGR